MAKIKGSIKILINHDYTSIEIEDRNANTVFVRIKLTPLQLSSALSRIAFTNCELEVNNLEYIGKTHENKQLEFEIPSEFRSSKYSKGLVKIAQTILDKNKEGWIAEGYFASQNSFFEKDGKQFARCTIRRWL